MNTFVLSKDTLLKCLAETDLELSLVEILHKDSSFTRDYGVYIFYAKIDCPMFRYLLVKDKNRYTIIHANTSAFSRFLFDTDDDKSKYWFSAENRMKYLEAFYWTKEEFLAPHPRHEILDSHLDITYSTSFVLMCPHENIY